MNIFMRMTQDSWSWSTLRKLLAEGDKLLKQNAELLLLISMTHKKIGAGDFFYTGPVAPLVRLELSV
jgi:hypothetical protein